MFFKEFEVDNEAMEEWLLWGGITLPHVMQQKDGSCFSVIEYEIYEKNLLTKAMEFPKFCRGWAMWNEKQHTLKGDKNFLVIFWNPFTTKLNPQIENTLGEKVLKENFLKYFGKETEKICKEFSKITKAKLLKYQDLMNFLTFTLTLDEKEIKMPEIPLYMDALLSQDVKFQFKANEIFINDKKILILSLPDVPNVWKIFEEIKNISYRYVRRILIFDDKESETEIKKYCGKWCPNRKIMLQEIEQGILSKLNGYFWNGFIFLLNESEEKIFREKMEKFLSEQEISFLFEEYNLKDIWWGSLAGMYLANITPPLVGFESVEEFILNAEKIQSERQEHKFKKILEEMGAENVQNGQI